MLGLRIPRYVRPARIGGLATVPCFASSAMALNLGWQATLVVRKEVARIAAWVIAVT
jgi:hypothetical protein